jgi:putative alpha-1,2-mannosidase
MTRWTAVTRANYVSSTPYNVTDPAIHGFQGTHQPAIWMGESGQCAIQAGVGEVRPAFSDRGLAFSRDDEEASATHYRVKMQAGAGQTIVGEHTSTSRVGHIRYTFDAHQPPFVVLQATRKTVITSNPNNVTDVFGGAVHIDATRQEISGRNPEWVARPLSYKPNC